MFQQVLFKLLKSPLFDHYIVYPNASLASILKLSVAYLVSGEVHVCGVVNDEWAFATQFENARNQVCCSSFCDESAFLCASSEADNVKLRLS
jgi:hypothetical protein